MKECFLAVEAQHKQISAHWTVKRPRIWPIGSGSIAQTLTTYHLGVGEEEEGGTEGGGTGTATAEQTAGLLRAVQVQPFLTGVPAASAPSRPSSPLPRGGRRGAGAWCLVGGSRHAAVHCKLHCHRRCSTTATSAAALLVPPPTPPPREFRRPDPIFLALRLPWTFRCLFISQKRIAPALLATYASCALEYFGIGLEYFLVLDVPAFTNLLRLLYLQPHLFLLFQFCTSLPPVTAKSETSILPMAKTSLPPGFRFHPTDVELTVYYLKRKLLGKHLRCNAITEIDLYKFAPWDLPEKASLESNDLVWYFFCPRDRKYSSGLRTNRSTGVGYWKATGKDRPVVYNSRTVGMKRTLVFHLGKPPRGDRTDWVMYEYRLEDEELAASGVKLDACVLCKIFQKSGPGPKIGAQYGAPFNEEDWNDASNVECSPSAPSVAPCVPESSHGVLNSAGQQLAVSYDGKVSLGSSAESINRPAVNGVHPDRPSPDIPNDCIHIQLLAEIIRCSSMHLLCTGGEDGLLPDSTADYDSDNRVSLDDVETIFCEVDEIGPQALVNNTNHCDSCGEHLIHPMLVARGAEQYLELNDLSFSLTDGPNSCGMLFSNDVSVEQPPDVELRFEQVSRAHISDTANASTSTTAGSSASVPFAEDHRT